MINEALKYIKQGKSILPVAAKSKNALIKEWQKKACLDEEQIRIWWTKWSDANIGLVCSEKNNLCVLDIDPRNGGDVTLAELTAKYGRLPETVEVITGGGGRHYYFQYDHRFGVEPEFRKGIDCKNNGYVVAPPSVHASGGIYRFAEGKSLDDIPIAKAPEWMLKGAERSQKQPLIELFGKVSEGGRNNAIARITGALINQGLDPSMCFDIVMVVNKGYSPPLEEDEVRKTVQSIWQTHLSQISPDELELSPPESVRDLLGRNIPPVEYWVKGVVQKEGRTLISAPTNQGKSIFALQLCMSVATGCETFMGVFGVEKANVLYLDWEMGERPVNARLKKMTGALGIPENLYIKFMQGKDILDLKIKGQIEKWLQTLGIKLLVIDPIGNAWFGDENTKQEVVTLTSYLDTLISKFGISYVMVHHHRKAIKGQQQGGQMAAGSYKWEGGVDHHVTIDGKDMDHVMVGCAKDRTGQKFEKSMFKLNLETMLLEYVGDCKSKYTDEVVVRLIKEMGQSEVSTPELIDYSKKHDGPGESKIREIIKSSDKFDICKKGKTDFIRLVDDRVNHADCLFE